MEINHPTIHVDDDERDDDENSEEEKPHSFKVISTNEKVPIWDPQKKDPHGEDFLSDTESRKRWDMDS